MEMKFEFVNRLLQQSTQAITITSVNTLGDLCLQAGCLLVSRDRLRMRWHVRLISQLCLKCLEIEKRNACSLEGLTRSLIGSVAHHLCPSKTSLTQRDDTHSGYGYAHFNVLGDPVFSDS